MADVLIAINGRSCRNGGVVVSNSTYQRTSNHTIDPKINKTAQFATQSGVLDSRFDDVRYYSGDTSA
jgi:hypothetical protein